MNRSDHQLEPAMRSVVLVHHHTLLRESLAGLLETGGFDVLAQAGDGNQAWDLVASRSPDLLVMEWEAPGVDEGLLARLATDGTSPAVVIITRPDAEQALPARPPRNAVGWLSVNMPARDFMNALDMLVSGRMSVLISQEMGAAMREGAQNGAGPLDDLSPREAEVLRLVAEGATNREIAESLFISEHTAKAYLRRLLAKLKVRNRQQAAAVAVREGILD